MILSKFEKEREDLFEEILQSSVNHLPEIHKKEGLEDSPQGFEKLVYKSLCVSSVGSCFENRIDLVSGYSFPDIRAFCESPLGYFGVEVKSTKQNKWESLGNSVLESTRIENIRKIYLVFGKFGGDPAFKWKPYEDCLQDVAVTHSPRYLINMNLSRDDTIFSKMGVDYSDLTRSGNPLGKIVSYLRSTCQKGEEPWWISYDETPSGMGKGVVFWSSLKKETREALLIQGFARFPELLSNDLKHKYDNFSLWLVARHGVLNRSFRDIFSAGGKITLTVNGRVYNGVPRVFFHFNQFFLEIKKAVRGLSFEDIGNRWQINKDSNILKEWKKRIKYFSKGLLGTNTSLINDILKD